MMTLRILKKKSKAALPLLEHFPEWQREKKNLFLAPKEEAYHGLIIRCPHGNQHESRRLRCDCAWHVLKGTPMTGEMSGYYEPEWEERTTLEVLMGYVIWADRPATMSEREWQRALRITGVTPITEEDLRAMMCGEDDRDDESRSCDTCGGGGYVIEQRQECCGDLHPHDGCRGGCAVMREAQEVCPDCDGAGRRAEGA